MSQPGAWLPGPLDLAEAPQRAALAVLHTAARAAQRALIAAHPELHDPGSVYAHQPSPALCAADAVVEHAEAMITALGRYEQALLAPRHCGRTGADEDPIMPWRTPATPADGHRHRDRTAPPRR